jgi:membrane-bound inhibitor of C-type lysozyme
MTAFPGTPHSANGYWSSSTSGSNYANAIYVMFTVGDIGTATKANLGYVRCVRAG